MREDLVELSRMLARADVAEVYRAAVSTGTIFWALGILREVLGLVAADHEEDRAAMIETLRAWCAALLTRPKPRQGLLDRVAANAVAVFLADVSEVRGAVEELVDAVRIHVAAYERVATHPRPVCFCRVRGCERNEHFVRYALRYAGTSPDGCDTCPVRPLHYALGTKNDFMVRELVACGADVNARGPGLSTSMHWAATEEHMLVVLKAGFKPSAMAGVTNGGTVWEYHAKRGTVAALRAAVARSKSPKTADAVAQPTPTVSAKRRRVSIEVVPRDELWTPL
jgi:hypothetical protein